ncbi:Hypothetical predicted protein [Pelobates cultripes]|uniref:L1 transposable element RRM domain-containing protein n=1 Tax=Pelobates cultripes TaxID=61616 RepID=A0AAD1TDX0_PELCU|nr:Hypothetical predicted protein [Pelobates cultripes]
MSQQSGPMDEYLSTPQCMAGTRGPDKMAPGSPGTLSRSSSTQDSPRRDALTQMSAELAAISANMFSRQDKKELVAELRAAIREEVAAVRRDLSALEHRVGDLEVQQLQSEQSQRATDLATTRQGNLLLELRRQVEDLENRGRRNNIRVRGLPESEGETPREVLEGLFTQLLGEEAPLDFRLERAHRALRPPRRDGLPRDLVCCFQSFQLKESIMRAARALRTITYMDSFLRAAGLPEIPVPNWILDHPPTRPTGPTVPAEHLTDGAPRSSSTHRSGPSTAEE